MLFNYAAFLPIDGVKRSVKKNLHTDFLQVTYTKGEKEMMIEKVAEGKYLIEERNENRFVSRRILTNLNAVDVARSAFFGA